MNKPVLSSRQSDPHRDMNSHGDEIQQLYQGYDFHFEQQKGNRKRPKTPYKRKKMYEEI